LSVVKIARFQRALLHTLALLYSSSIDHAAVEGALFDHAALHMKAVRAGAGFR
jgi:hypothetical protein